jgi:hypothetical protein
MLSMIGSPAKSMSVRIPAMPFTNPPSPPISPGLINRAPEDDKLLQQLVKCIKALTTHEV